MKLRNYRAEDCATLATLFYETVHCVNVKDYSTLQLCAWADGNVDIAQWNTSFLAHHTLVAQQDGAIVGFGDMDDTGYLDRLYVHKQYQRQGIAKAITAALEQQAMQKGLYQFTTHASITAKPFFETQGYHIIRENTVVRHTVELTNFIMEKNLSKIEDICQQTKR